MGRGRFRSGPGGDTGTDSRILDPLPIEPGESATLSVIDPPATAVAYNWELDNGRTADGRVTTAQYNETGTFLPEVTIRDSGGQPITTLETEVNVVEPTETGEPEETSQDIRSPQAEPQEFDQTYRLTSSEVPFAVGDRPAIPFPWQGIPRTAVVYNLNYVYNESEEKWERDTGNRGGAVTVLDTGTVTIPDNGSEAAQTGVADKDKTVGVAVNARNVPDPGESVEFWSVDADAIGSVSADPAIASFPSWDPTGQEWVIQFDAYNMGGSSTVDYSFWEV